MCATDEESERFEYRFVVNIYIVLEIWALMRGVAPDPEELAAVSMR